jgi:hypothetical protein
MGSKHKRGSGGVHQLELASQVAAEVFTGGSSVKKKSCQNGSKGMEARDVLFASFCFCSSLPAQPKKLKKILII